MRRKREHSYSLVEFMRLMILVSAPLLVINIIISVVSVLNISQENRRNIDNFISPYLRQFASDTAAIERFVLWTATEEPLVSSLETADSLSARAENMNTIRSRVNAHKYATGQEYQYFAYLESQDLFFNASSLQIPYSDYALIRDYITSRAGTGGLARPNFTWRTFSTPTRSYLYYLICYRGFYFAAFVSLEDLSAPFSVLNLGRNGCLEFTDLSGQQLYLSNPDSHHPQERCGTLLYSLQTYDGQANALPFNLYLYSDNFSNYGGMLMIQLAVVISASLLCGVFAGIILLVYRRAVVPIEQFSRALADPGPSGELPSLEGSNIKELEQASGQFRNLIREIKRLRIDLYEKELEKERFEITFLQNQIRPHFYLNCLTTIGSMAQLEDCQSIQSMVLFTSNYFRYLFQTDKDLVRLEYELAHIQAYLDIQALRYGPVFTYECCVDKEDKQALILPLLLITFVENSLKHGMTGNSPLRLSLCVSRKQAENRGYLQIDIQDSGPGFSEDILRKIERKEKISEGMFSHIGISNSIQRLSLMYGIDYEIAFHNDPEGGAHVRVMIPLQTKEG